MVTIPMWMVWVVIAYVVVSCVANAMSMTDRSFYGFLFRFTRLLTFSAGKEMEQLHIPVPEVPTVAELNQTDSSAATKQ